MWEIGPDEFTDARELLTAIDDLIDGHLHHLRLAFAGTALDVLSGNILKWEYEKLHFVALFSEELLNKKCIY